jgi:probable F420-dependent oxidoreductase
LREHVLALRAIWQSWRADTELDFRGEFSTHTLMPPMFRPAPHGHPDPLVLLAGVGARLAEIAGEVADGLVVHPFSTAQYVDQVLVPALARGRSTAGGSARMVVSSAVLVATGLSEQERAESLDAVRRQIGFYASTAAYLPVLDMHGWASVHERASALVRRGDWEELAIAVPEDVLHAIAVIGDPAEVAAGLQQRAEGRIDRITPVCPVPVPLEAWREVATAIHAPV